MRMRMRMRNEVTGEVKMEKRVDLRNNMETWDRNFLVSWAAVAEHLCLRKPSSPATLVNDVIVKSSGQEMAEAITGQYMRKKADVKQAFWACQGQLTGSEE